MVYFGLWRILAASECQQLDQNGQLRNKKQVLTLLQFAIHYTNLIQTWWVSPIFSRCSRCCFWKPSLALELAPSTWYIGQKDEAPVCRGTLVVRSDDARHLFTKLRMVEECTQMRLLVNLKRCSKAVDKPLQNISLLQFRTARTVICLCIHSSNLPL